MDWANVTGEELLDALREVDWSSPPRPLTEFFQRFSSPKNPHKWRSRLKCNFYYYRTNYFAIIFLFLAMAFARNPFAFVAVVFSTIASACLNDSFAVTFSEKVVRGIRQVSPPLAAKMRAPQPRTGVRGRPLRGTVYICGQDRRLAVGALYTLSLFLWYLSSGYVTVFVALALSVGCIVLHATFRSPNLKARLNSFREEFRAVWRGYSDAP